MLYTPLTIKAMRYAYDAHHGQTDVSGCPYIFHPYHLAEQMEDEVSVCAALLHDVVEDTPITLEDLSLEFPPEVVRIVALLTHDPKVEYLDYVRALKSDATARRIKLADLAHNSDESRLCAAPGATPEKVAHWRKKYTAARAILLDEAQ